MIDRRSAASEEMGLGGEAERKEVERAKAKEAERREKKERRKAELESCPSYRLVKSVKTLMDGTDSFPIGLDAIIGFIPGGVGDVISQVLNVPSVYVALCKVKSIPLTLAVTYNMLVDILKGMVPFFIGDIWDAFNRSFSKNCKLITGYVEDDKEVIARVEANAVRMAVLIVVFCVLIWLLWLALAGIVAWIKSLFA